MNREKSNREILHCQSCELNRGVVAQEVKSQEDMLGDEVDRCPGPELVIGGHTMRSVKRHDGEGYNLFVVTPVRCPRGLISGLKDVMY